MSIDHIIQYKYNTHGPMMAHVGACPTHLPERSPLGVMVGKSPKLSMLCLES